MAEFLTENRTPSPYARPIESALQPTSALTGSSTASDVTTATKVARNSTPNAWVSVTPRVTASTCSGGRGGAGQVRSRPGSPPAPAVGDGAGRVRSGQVTPWVTASTCSGGRGGSGQVTPWVTDSTCSGGRGGSGQVRSGHALGHRQHLQ